MFSQRIAKQIKVCEEKKEEYGATMSCRVVSDFPFLFGEENYFDCN